MEQQTSQTSPTVRSLLVQAMEQNRAVQEAVNAASERTTRLISGINAIRERLRSTIDQGRLLSSHRTPVCTFFPTQGRTAPADNADLAAKKEWEKGRAFKLGKWSKTEIASLKSGIAKERKKKLANELLDPRRQYKSVPDFQRYALELRGMTEDQALARNDIEIDWEVIQKTYVPERTVGDCKATWVNQVNPAINKRKWTAAEEAALLSAVRELGERNWMEVAKRVGRLPYQCLSQYQRALNPRHLKKAWSDDDRAKLRRAVEKVGEKSWVIVATMIHGFQGSQCLHSWKNIRPGRTQGPWLVEESKALLVAVAFHGCKAWADVAKNVKTKTDVQCREHWSNVRGPFLCSDPWTREEDRALLAAVQQNTSCGAIGWAEVAEKVPRRTDNQCLRRWKELSQDQSKEYLVMRRTFTEKMPGNHVGRSKDRSSLTPKEVSTMFPTSAGDERDDCDDEDAGGDTEEEGEEKDETPRARTPKRKKPDDDDTDTEDEDEDGAAPSATPSKTPKSGRGRGRGRGRASSGRGRGSSRGRGRGRGRKQVVSEMLGELDALSVSPVRDIAEAPLSMTGRPIRQVRRKIFIEEGEDYDAETRAIMQIDKDKEEEPIDSDEEEWLDDRD